MALTRIHCPSRILLPLLAIGVALASVSSAVAAENDGDIRPRIALVTTYYEPASHADAIGTKLIEGMPRPEPATAMADADAEVSVVEPRVEIVSIWIDQSTPDDLGHAIAERHGIPIFDSIRDALTLGGDELAVDGVLFLGEHGDYPRNRFGSKMYPRVTIMDPIYRVFDETGESVPVFVDKMLSHNWHDAQWIVDRAADLDAELMAGSSLPVTLRRPALEHPIDAPIEEAVAIGFGPTDAYGFHALEILQCMIERRSGGETGVASVRAVRGPRVYELADEGLFSMELAEAACRDMDNRRDGRIRDNEPDPLAIVVDYTDGTRGTVLMIGRHTRGSWGYAARLADGETVSTEFVLDGTRGRWSHFTWLNLNIEQMFLTGASPIPVERTLITTGILDAALRSLANDGEIEHTPHMAGVTYRPLDAEVHRAR